MLVRLMWTDNPLPKKRIITETRSRANALSGDAVAATLDGIEKMTAWVKANRMPLGPLLGYSD